MELTETPEIDWNAELKQHDRWLRTVVYARVGERQAIDDVMQEVALAAVEQKRPLTDASKVRPWLYRLAVLRSLLYRRGQGRKRKLIGRYRERTYFVEVDPDPDPLEWLLSDERRKTIRQALEELAPRDKELLLLKYTEDWSYREIAEHLGISTSAVEARLHRARQRMRERLTTFDMIEVGK